ncbi:MAG: Y-family DNA polymerase [Bacteroidales bacterium]|nr:Y-family DNA polymerase [Bacteroidales bacterium]
MIALADCNTFFASVEKVFHPGLQGKPVCVLSSNDGNIVALTREAKALGIRRGAPYFEVKDIIERNHVAVFSGNIMLYAAMSKRVQSIMRRSVARSEAYSIDEQFLYLDGYEKYYDLEEYMREMVQRIKLWTDIPVSVGIARTKTLAKVASKFAKNYSGYRSVCMIDSEEKRRKALSLFELKDVWGIGRHTLEKLNALGITGTLQFADMPGEWVRKHLTKPGVQTWMELNGHPCIDTAEIIRRQSVTTSRSFGEMISDKEQLKAAVASFAGSCANTLRGQLSSAASVTVFATSNRFRDDLEQYSGIRTMKLAVASSDTVEITEAAMKLVDSIYRPGIMYKKAGVILGDIECGAVQQDLFDPVPQRAERVELSRAMDMLNHRYGVKTIRLAVEGGKDEKWKVKSDHRTPNYLTDIDELMTINI